MRNKWVIIIVLITVLLVTLQISSAAGANKMPEKDSTELKFQDMLVLFLLPYMNDKLSEGAQQKRLSTELSRTFKIT